MPTIDEELIQNAKAVFHGKVEHSEDVTFGKNTEFDGEVTINSAKDLKTKDGTGFGGSLPSPWLVDSNTLMWILENEGLKAYIGFILLDNTMPVYGCDFSQIGECTSYLIPIGATYNANDSVLCIYKKGDITSRIFVDVDFINNSTEINLSDINTNKAEIAKKQSTLYRHTIDIDAGGLGLHTFVTALSEKNTVIDSIQDLVAVFGNTKLMATGMFGTNSEYTAMLEVGTSLTNTYVHSGHGTKNSLSDWAQYGPDESRLIITDSVTAM